MSDDPQRPTPLVDGRGAPVPDPPPAAVTAAGSARTRALTVAAVAAAVAVVAWLVFADRFAGLGTDCGSDCTSPPVLGTDGVAPPAPAPVRAACCYTRAPVRSASRPPRWMPATRPASSRVK